MQLWAKKWPEPLLAQVVTFATDLRELRRSVPLASHNLFGSGDRVPDGSDGNVQQTFAVVIAESEAVIADSLLGLATLMQDTVDAAQSVTTALHTGRALQPGDLWDRARGGFIPPRLAAAALLYLGIAIHGRGDSATSDVASKYGYAHNSAEFTTALARFTPRIPLRYVQGCPKCYSVIGTVDPSCIDSGDPMRK